MRTGSDRAQSVQVGMVFLLAAVVVSLSLYQATVVPQQNHEIEFDAYQDARTDMADLQRALLEAGTRDTTVASTVTTGTRYPPRALFLNPTTARGSLKTTTSDSVTVDGARAIDPDTRDYWSGDAQEFTTRDIVFAPDYNSYEDTPVRISTGLVYRQYDDDVVLRDAGQPFVQGNRLTLLTAAGDLQASGESTTVTVTPASASMQSVAVTGANDDINVTIPTTIPADVWRNSLLQGQIAPNGHVLDVAEIPDRDAVTVTLDGDVTYELRMARLVVSEGGTDASDVSLPAHYLDTDHDEHVSTGADSRVKLTVEARDRLNNPVSNANVTFESSAGEFETRDGTSLGADSATVRTDDDGTAIVWHNLNDDYGVHTVDAAIGTSLSDPSAREHVAIDVVHSDSDSFSDGVIVHKNSAPAKQTRNNVYDAVELDFQNVASSDLQMTKIRLDHFVLFKKAETGSDSATVSEGPTAGVQLELLDGGSTVASERIDAKEGGAPASLSSNDFVMLANSERSVVLTFDQAYELKNDEAAMGSITIYYEGGLSASYSVFLFG